MLIVIKPPWPLFTGSICAGSINEPKISQPQSFRWLHSLQNFTIVIYWPECRVSFIHTTYRSSPDHIIICLTDRLSFYQYPNIIYKYIITLSFASENIQMIINFILLINQRESNFTGNVSSVRKPKRIMPVVIKQVL